MQQTKPATTSRPITSDQMASLPLSQVRPLPPELSPFHWRSLGLFQNSETSDEAETDVSLGACRIYREAVTDNSPGLLGLGFCHKELALKGRPNAMLFRRGSHGLHFHPFPSVAPSGRIPMELSQA